MKPIIFTLCLILAGCCSQRVKAIDDPVTIDEPTQEEAETWLIVGQSNIERGRFIVEFTKAMNLAGRPIAALIATEGSTPISCWRRGGRCWESYVKNYIGIHIDGIVYWQGESDGVAEDGDSWKTYGASFTSLIQEYREDFGRVPVVYVTLEYYDADKTTAGFQEPETMTYVREQQGQALLLPDVFTVDARPYSTGELDLTAEQYDNIAVDIANVILD